LGPFDSTQIPVELQGWWTPQPDNGKGFGHIHALCKWPLGQEITGILRTNCRITLHDNPSTLRLLRFDLANISTVASIPLNNLTCPYDGFTSTNCSWNVPVELDTSTWPSGWVHLRVRATVETPDLIRWTTSSEIPLKIGTSDTITSFPNCLANCVIGKSWYEGFDYQRVLINNVPSTPVSGIHTFQVQAFKGDNPPTQRLQVFLDKSHIVPATDPWPQENPSTGSQLLDIVNPDPNALYEVPVDITTLANGWHSLGARTIEAAAGTATCSYCSTDPNFQTGVAKIWFFVENP
jgi:hypothetical protein